MEQPFDDYSKDYAAAISHPLRSLLERDGDNEFLRAKARWLVRWWTELGAPPPRLLDYGCGTGFLTRYLHDLRPDWTYCGIDPSAGMIERARANAPFASFEVLGSEPAPAHRARFQLAVMSGVLHHIAWQDWPATFDRIRYLLEPGGHLVIFEHNPLNPLTQVVVRSTPIDADAVLHRAGFVERMLKAAAFQIGGRSYMHFWPPRYHGLAPVERVLGWVPLGGGYAIVSRSQ
jgi:SAM-dependent methyltransferase